MKRAIAVLLVVMMAVSSVVIVSAENSQAVSAKYNKVVSDEAVESTINFSVQWGKMEFTYTVTESKEWNTTTHQYDKVLSEGTWEADGNTVTVTNNSNTAIAASFDYESASEYSAISGSFSSSTVVLESAENLADGEDAPATTVELTLSGALSDTVTSMTKIGTVTVAVEEAVLPETVSADSLNLGESTIDVKFGDSSETTPIQEKDGSNYWVLSLQADAFNDVVSSVYDVSTVENLDDIAVQFEVYYRTKGSDDPYYHVTLKPSSYNMTGTRYVFFCEFVSTGMHFVFEVDETYEFVVGVKMNDALIGSNLNADAKPELAWTQELAAKLA